MKHIIILLSGLCLSLQSFAFTRAPDNSEVNKRDRESGAITADQQSFTTRDMDISRKIRKAILNEENMSVYAQNVKIISIDGKVTLKGPVRTMNEQNTIVRLARESAGANNVTNEMSIKNDN